MSSRNENRIGLFFGIFLSLSAANIITSFLGARLNHAVIQSSSVSGVAAENKSNGTYARNPISSGSVLGSASKSATPFERGLFKQTTQDSAYLYSGNIPLAVLIVDEQLGVALVSLPDGTWFMSNNKDVVRLGSGACFRFEATLDAPSMHVDPLVHRASPADIVDFNKTPQTDPFGGQM